MEEEEIILDFFYLAISGVQFYSVPGS